MNRPRPSASTLNAVLTSCGKTISCAATPTGDWLEYRPELPGYDASQLLLAFADGSSLLVWSELVRYGPEPWHESFVLHAETMPTVSDPLCYTNPGASEGFARAQPIDQVFAGRAITKPELFVDLGGTYTPNETDYLPSDGLRLLVGAASIELLTEGPHVLPLSLVLRGAALPVFKTVSTGEQNWLSSQHHHQPTLKPRTDGDA